MSGYKAGLVKQKPCALRRAFALVQGIDIRVCRGIMFSARDRDCYCADNGRLRSLGVGLPDYLSLALVRKTCGFSDIFLSKIVDKPKFLMYYKYI